MLDSTRYLLNLYLIFDLEDVLIFMALSVKILHISCGRNAQTTLKKTHKIIDISIILLQTKHIKGNHWESDMPLYNLKVTWNNVPCPFKRKKREKCKKTLKT